MRKLGKKGCDALLDRMLSKADSNFEFWEDLIEVREVQQALGIDNPIPLCGAQIANYSRGGDLPMIGEVEINGWDDMEGSVPFKDSISAALASNRIRECGGSVKLVYQDEADYGGTAVDFEAKTLNSVKCLVDRLLERA